MSIRRFRLLAFALTLSMLESACTTTTRPVRAPVKAVPNFAMARETQPDVVERLSRRASDASGIEIYFFPTDQADSMLIIGPAPEHRTLLVDAGEPVTKKVGNAALIYDKLTHLLGTPKLNYVLVTHFHEDHVGLSNLDACGRSAKNLGLFSLFAQEEGQFSVDTLLDPGDDDEAYIPKRSGPHCGVINDAPQWIAASALGKRVTPTIGDTDINLGPGVDVQIVTVSGRVENNAAGLMDQLAASNPTLYSTDQPASENDRSIAFFLRYHDFTMFSGGDLTGSSRGHETKQYEIQSYPGGGKTVYTNVESFLVHHFQQDGTPTHVSIYRADHHGSGHSSNTDLINALQPNVVVYSSGEKNTYQHPDPGTVEALCQMTPNQYVTSGVSTQAYPHGFPSRCGQVVGDDIHVVVAADGSSYTVNGDAFSSIAH